MALLDWFRRAPVVIQQKASAVGRVLHMQTMGSPVWTPRQYDRLAAESYMKNAIAYRCVRLIAEAAASIPFLVYEKDDELEEHELLTLLRRPNPFQSGDELWDAFYSFYRIAGNSYLEAVALDSKPRELFVLRPDRMKLTVSETGYPEAYLYSVGGQKEVRFDMTQVGRQLPLLHMREFHPLSDWYGMAPVEAGAYAVDVHNSAGSYNKALLDNQARPSGALVYSPPTENSDASLTDKQFDRLKKEIEEKYSGSQNAGRPMVLEGGLDWKEMATSPKDMEFIEGKREAAREVALTYGVPPQLLGIPGDNTFSNYQEANRAFYRQTVLPLVQKTCRALTNFFAPTWPTLRIDYNEDEIPALDTEREALWKRLNESKFLTINEKREAVGYEPYEPKEPGEDGTGGEKVGDVILIGSGDTPLLTTDIVPGGAAGVEEDEIGGDEASEEEDADSEPAADKVGAKPKKGNARTAKPPRK